MRTRSSGPGRGAACKSGTKSVREALGQQRTEVLCCASDGHTDGRWTYPQRVHDSFAGGILPVHGYAVFQIKYKGIDVQAEGLSVLGAGVCGPQVSRARRGRRGRAATGDVHV